MLTIIKNSAKDLISKAIKDTLVRERRNYGLDIRLWNHRDPRVDQSFFQASVPGFVLGVDQKIIDWNIGFELVFGSHADVKRGMNISEWYGLIENFKRLPNREEQLHGEAVLPITDRERVVFLSSDYGRMVFMKIMSPVMDRHSGRVIGWNITLNVNSVHERVKFFTALNERIQQASRHGRFVVGIDQVAKKSRIFHDAVHNAVMDIGIKDEVLVIGALGAGPFIEEFLGMNPSSRVQVLDHDTEALRHLRDRLAHYGTRVKLVRKSRVDVSELPTGKFDAALLLWPEMSNEQLNETLDILQARIKEKSSISIVSWNADEGAKKFLTALRRDLEERGEVDLIRWHMGIIQEEFAKRQSICLESGTLILSGLSVVHYGVAPVS